MATVRLSMRSLLMVIPQALPSATCFRWCLLVLLSRSRHSLSFSLQQLASPASAAVSAGRVLFHLTGFGPFRGVDDNPTRTICYRAPACGSI